MSEGVSTHMHSTEEVPRYASQQATYLLEVSKDTPCVAWPVYVRLESLIERWGSRQLCLSRKLRGKIDVFAEELPRKSSPWPEIHDAREEIGE